MIETQSRIFPIERLREFSTRVFLHFGMPKEDATQVADVLACADLRGIDSHGATRMYGYFGMPSEENRSRAEEAGADSKGWAIDGKGRHTKNPNEMIEGGAMLPLGSERERRAQRRCAGDDGRHFVRPIERGELGPFAPPFALRQEIRKRSVGKGIGHFFGAMRIDGFIAADEFKRQIDEYVRVFLATKPAPGTKGPLIPGDPEREAEKV